MKKINRKLNTNNDLIRINSDKTSNIEKAVMDILLHVIEIKSEQKKQQFREDMDTTDLSEYFPIKSEESLEEFLRIDDKWNQRKKVLASSSD